MSDTYFERKPLSAAQKYHLIRGAIFGHVIGDALGMWWIRWRLPFGAL